MEAIQINIYESEIDTMVDLLDSMNSPTAEAVANRIVTAAVELVDNETDNTVVEGDYILINVIEDDVVEYAAAELVYLAYDAMFEGDE